MNSADTDIDPVVLELIWSRLRGIPAEMGEHLLKTAFSHVIKYSEDFSTAVFTKDGRLLAQGVYTPGHLGAMPRALQGLLADKFPIDAWEEKDVIITNDPYLISGHYPDIATFEPVFIDGELHGFCVTIAHHTDIGGSEPGSIALHVTDMFAEGLCIPPVRLVENKELRDEIEEILLRNTRVPRLVRGDLRAQLAASTVGVDRFESLITKFGSMTFSRYAEEIIQRTEQTTRDAIGELPNQTASFVDQLTGFDTPITIQAEITVSNDEMTVDFEGTSRQIKELAINSTENYTFAYSIYAVKAAIDPTTPPAHGMLNPISVKVPKGSVLNPEPPVPVGTRHIVSNRIVSTLIGALSTFLPKNIPASGSQDYVQLIEFPDSDEEQTRLLADVHYGGAGARPDRDGYPAVSADSNVKNTPIETIEAEYPVRFHEYRLSPDSAGAGTFRGGLGTIRGYEFLNHANVQCYNGRFEEGPFGLAGGSSGTPGQAVLELPDGTTEKLASKVSISVEPGSVLRIFTAGGGGYGPPRQREKEAIKRDVENGVMSKEAVREIYGFIEGDGT